MAIPLKYNIKSLLNRKVSTILICLGIALVVLIFISMMAMALSMKQALVRTGCDDNIIIKNKSTSSFEFGFLPEDVLNVIKYLPGIKKNHQGIPLVSPELYSRRFIKFGEEDRVTWLRIRGITPIALEVYPQLKIKSGKMFHRGEVIIGKEVPTKFGKNFRLGDTIQTGRQQRVIAGIFESQGSAYEGEIWMHKQDMKLDFDIENISLVTLKLESPSLKNSFIQQVNQNTKLTMADAISEVEYYASLTGTATFVLVMGIIISVLMSLGAIFGGMNIMYLTITARTRELGTLRALGYTPFHILVSLMIESLIIAAFGGIIGSLLSLGINGYSLDLFEVAFSINITLPVIFLGFLVSLLIGFFGGLLPGLSAAKIPVVNALRHI